MSDKEAIYAYSGPISLIADAVWYKIDEHTGLLFFDCALDINYSSVIKKGREMHYV